MTKQTLDKLPEGIRANIEYYKEAYNLFDTGSHYKDEERSRMAGYVHGLRDAGLITEIERRELFCYMTV